ncbi:MAG TPA: phage terminase large subunit [Pseudolabrys sp.]|jgi:predicted phage terminase large subunit-like protein
MQNELASGLRTNYLAFTRKAIRELDGTSINNAPYLDYLATYLSSIDEGKIRRLVINIAPRHLKTLMAAVCLSGWTFMHKPGTKILIVTYSEELALQIARSVRAILQGDWFKQISKTRIMKGHARASKFATTAGGELYATSIDGSVTGFGADLIIVDDPHNVTDAGNPKQLARTIDRFYSAVLPRLNNPKTGRIIVIGQRIHDDDLSAHLVASGGWEHVVLPLVATRDQTYHTAYGPWHRRKGEPLRPDATDLNNIERLRARLVNPSFELLYQQDVDGQALPSITEESFPTYTRDELRNLPHYVSIDAGTDEGDDKSFSVIQVWATDGQDHCLVEQFRERCDFHDLGRTTRRLAKRYRAKAILIERAANGHALITELTRMQRKRVYGITPRGSKAARFRPHIAKILAGHVQLPADALCRPDFVQELVAFPHGRYTDQVDAFTQYMDWIEKQGSRPNPQAPNPPRVSAVVGLNGQYRGRDWRYQPKATDPGIMAASGNSYRMPNGPFLTVKSGPY